ncbi:MAG: metallophosphoesterase [Proteiniphilum sp.]
MNDSHHSILAALFLCIAFTLSAQVPGGYYEGAEGKSGAALKIAVMTDVHYLSPLLAGEGEALVAFEKATGRKTTELHAVLNKVIASLKEEAPDMLLVTGDITNHGERQSHLDFIALLRQLEKAGTRIFVIPGNHDVLIPDAKMYKGSGSTPVESVSADEFARLYGTFGYEEAMRRDETSLSYLAMLNERTWLLCIDSNRYNEQTTSSVTAGRIGRQTMEWALNILREAKEKGITVLGMMHHGVVEHMPYQDAFFPDYLVEDWQQQADKLADAGLNVIFTGHFHASDISLHTSPAGNRIHDVETASLAQYPFGYRIMQLQGNELSVSTRFVTSIPGNPDFEHESRRRLEAVTRRVAQSRLNKTKMPMTEEVKTALTDLIVQLNLMHVRGDEEADPGMKRAISMFASMMGTAADMESFAFDFPPEDNKVVIRLNVGEE